MFLPDRRARETDDLELGNHTRSPSLESGSAHDGSSSNSGMYGKKSRGGDGRARHHRTPGSSGNVDGSRRDRSARRTTDGDGRGRGTPGHGRRRSGGGGGGSRSGSSSRDGGDGSGRRHRRGGGDNDSGSSRARTALRADADEDAGLLLEASGYSGMSGMVVVDRKNNVGSDGGGGGMGGGGQEPAVQSNGCMKTSTALKLVSVKCT